MHLRRAAHLRLIRSPLQHQTEAKSTLSVQCRSVQEVRRKSEMSDGPVTHTADGTGPQSAVAAADRQTDLHFDLHRRDGPNFDMPARRHAANLAEHRRSASIHNSIARPLSSFGRHRPLPQSACTDECVHSARQPLHQLLFALRRQRRAQTGTTCACACLCAWRLSHAVGPLLTLHAAKQPSSQPHRLLLLLRTHSAKRASCRADRHRTGGVIAYSR